MEMIIYFTKVNSIILSSYIRKFDLKACLSSSLEDLELFPLSLK